VLFWVYVCLSYSVRRQSRVSRAPRFYRVRFTFVFLFSESAKSCTDASQCDGLLPNVCVICNENSVACSIYWECVNLECQIETCGGCHNVCSKGYFCKTYTDVDGVNLALPVVFFRVGSLIFFCVDVGKFGRMCGVL
jgi:hypothetical protein